MIRVLAARPRLTIAALAVLVFLGAAAMIWNRSAGASTVSATVERGTLTVQLTVGGTLRPAESITYRSPLGGREAEILFLVAEGTRVGEGDLLARLDSTELQRELDRSVQEARSAQVDLQVAEIDWQTAQAAVDSLAKGEGALGVTEAQARLQVSQRKVDRLRAEFEAFKPLLEKGFITREELNRTADALEQAEGELALDRQRATVLVEQTHPGEEQRARLQLAQKAAQRENVRARVQEVDARVKLLQEQIEDCRIFARRPGLAVHEPSMSANPRRKVRVGDRVTSSQGLVTIPEVDRMVVEASAGEADVHRLRPGQPATIRLEAFPDLRLTGRLARVGTLASSSPDRPAQDKRFDVVIDVDATDTALRPEMTARADIQIGVRTAVLLVSVNAIFERDGRPVCHVVGRWGVVTRPVEIGEASDLLVEITAGLTEGERVALVDVAGGSGAAGPGAAAPPTQQRDARPARNPLSPR